MPYSCRQTQYMLEQTNLEQEKLLESRTENAKSAVRVCWALDVILCGVTNRVTNGVTERGGIEAEFNTIRKI